MTVQNKLNQCILPKSPVVLWIASWYPSKVDCFNGDFVQRAAKAFALNHPLHVLYVVKDPKGLITQKVLEQTFTSGELTETIIYYYPKSVGWRPLDGFLSFIMYFQIGRSWLSNFKKLNNNKPLVVEVAVAMRAGLLAVWLKRRFGISYVVQEHWTGYYRQLMPRELKRSKWFWWCTKYILSLANGLLPDSRHLGEWINQTILPISFIEIPNTVDINLFYPNLDFIPTSTFRWLHVSTLGYQKNTDAIIRSMLRMPNELPLAKIELVIIGPEPEHLFILFPELDRNPFVKIIFTGAIPYPEVANEMRKSHALVLFSRYENLPCVMLEAFCTGIPVVATNVGGIAYHLSPNRGLVITSEDEAALMQAIIGLMAKYTQYNRAEIAQQAAEQYGMQAISSAYNAAYQQFFPEWNAYVNG